MKFSLWPDNDRPPAALLDEVRSAEAAGWHGVWLADHYMPNTGDATPARGDAYECWGLLPALAAVTERVRIGTLVSPTSVHHPALLAKRAATIDRLSGGRMVLGLGAGWQINEHHAYGIELEPPGQAGEPVRGGDHDRPVDAVGRTRPRSTASSTTSPTPPATPSRSSRRCRSWSAPAARGCSASPRARRTSGTPGEPRAGRRPPRGAAGGLRQGRPRSGHDADLGQRVHRPWRDQAAGGRRHALRLGVRRGRSARAVRRTRLRRVHPARLEPRDRTS